MTHCGTPISTTNVGFIPLITCECLSSYRELISRELYSTAVTIVSNQYSSNSTLVDRNVLNLGMRAALEMIKRTQKKKVARAYRTWIRQAFNKLILVAEDHLRGHARLQALETATIHNLPRNVIQALCSPLLLPCRKSHKHKHVANAVEATKTHSSESTPTSLCDSVPQRLHSLIDSLLSRSHSTVLFKDNSGFAKFPASFSGMH